MTTNDVSAARRLFDLDGQVAIVTGAARGMGRAISEGLASVGVSVALADINNEELTRSEEAIAARNQRCLAVSGDLCDPAYRGVLVDATMRTFGQIDILVNCAGITRPSPSESYPDEDWDMTLAVNLSAIFHLCKLVANRDMIPRRTGVIINIASINSVVGFPNNPAYLAAKGGLLQLSRGFATDWARYNIRVNTICPGYINTPLSAASYNDPQARAMRASRTLLNRWGQPEELVGPVIFLASQASTYITGNDLFVDGGWAKSGMTAHDM